MKLFQLVTRKKIVASAHAHPMEKAHQGDSYIDQRRESSIVEAQLTQIGEFHNPDKKTSHPAVKTKVTADERGRFNTRRLV